mmetsp:Transcript_33598/g.62060  ORF Transcript_33598/g.62060 Transcript_33598/m.62060 type:complete len:114 (+) Transcript_33598:1254-1595(+)
MLVGGAVEPEGKAAQALGSRRRHHWDDPMAPGRQLRQQPVRPAGGPGAASVVLKLRSVLALGQLRQQPVRPAGGPGAASVVLKLRSVLALGKDVIADDTWDQQVLLAREIADT